MRLVLDPAHDAAHGEWLRRVSGGYEWWYFDAVSDDHEWALTCIWFLGNPFSPYYRLAVQNVPADPFAHNAVFFALHRRGLLHAYHFTRYPKNQVCADERQAACLRFGPSALNSEGGHYHLRLSDQNANGRQLTADLRFDGWPLTAPPDEEPSAINDDAEHFWLPAAPACRVSGSIILREPHNSGAERIVLRGVGYHDHNWGRLPFGDTRDWYWARATFPNGRAAALYDVSTRDSRHRASHLLVFDQGALVSHCPDAQVRRERMRPNAFGMRHATRLIATGGATEAVFTLKTRLDSSPFYVRALSDAALTHNGKRESGFGMAEYFCPRLLGARLAASAMKARIVEA